MLDGRPDLALLFVSPALAADPWTLSATIADVLSPVHLIGCTTEAPLAQGRELEDEPALALWALRGSTVAPIVRHLSIDGGGERPTVDDWMDRVDALASDTPIILLADPFTFATDVLLADSRARDLPPIVGGMASGGRRAGEHVLFVDDAVHFEGAAAVAVVGMRAVALVSQGCEPIGPDMVITAGGGPVIEELAGAVAFDRIMTAMGELEGDPRVAGGMILGGIVVDENRPEYGRGDFLVRAIHGRDPDTGAVFVGENVRIGQTFHLQLRDADTARADLTLALGEATDKLRSSPAVGALVFTCNGRGARLFGEPDHDARATHVHLATPSAGMFCNGEIGPVGRYSYIHGYSVSLLVFTECS